MTEKNKKRIGIINKRKSSMPWNELISRQIKESEASRINWERDRWMKSIGIEDDLEMELICTIVASLIPS